MRVSRFFKKILRVLAILLPCFSVFFMASDSYAIADHVKVWDSNASDGSSVLPDCNSSCLRDYHYLIIESSSSSNYTTYRLRIRRLQGNNQRVEDLTLYTYDSLYILDISNLDYNSPFNVLSFNGMAYFSTVSVTFTLSDSLPGSCSGPSGSISINSNGEYDVSSYATAVVDVPAETIPGDYHDDLVSLRLAIYTCAAVVMVVYFFFCIYKFMIGDTKR